MKRKRHKRSGRKTRRKGHARRPKARKRIVTRTTSVRVVESNPLRLLVPTKRYPRDLRLAVSYPPDEASPRGWKAPRTKAERAYAVGAARLQRRAGRAFAAMVRDLAAARTRLAQAGG